MLRRPWLPAEKLELSLPVDGFRLLVIRAWILDHGFIVLAEYLYCVPGSFHNDTPASASGNSVVVMLIELDTTILVHRSRIPAHHVIWNRGQHQQLGLLLGEQLFDRISFRIVRTFHVRFRFLEQLLIEGRNVVNTWDRHKPVSAAVTYLALHIPFLVGASHVTEFGFKAIVQTEPVKALVDLPVLLPQSHCRRKIVEAYLVWNPAQVLEDPLQSLQQTLAVLARQRLRKPSIAVWKTENQILKGG